MIQELDHAGELNDSEFSRKNALKSRANIAEKGLVIANRKPKETNGAKGIGEAPGKQRHSPAHISR